MEHSGDLLKGPFSGGGSTGLLAIPLAARSAENLAGAGMLLATLLGLSLCAAGGGAGARCGCGVCVGALCICNLQTHLNPQAQRPTHNTRTPGLPTQHTQPRGNPPLSCFQSRAMGIGRWAAGRGGACCCCSLCCLCVAVCWFCYWYGFVLLLRLLLLLSLLCVCCAAEPKSAAGGVQEICCCALSRNSKTATD